jgi:predicted DNA-binding protein with PD1-like motif
VKTSLLSNMDGRREWAIIFDPGDEVMAALKPFVHEQHLSAAHFTAIGAFSQLTIAWFDVNTLSYHPIEIAQQVEVLNLTGDVALSKDQPVVHAHVTVAGKDGAAHGGHLQKAHVLPTLEMILIESPAHLRKTYRPEFGLALIDLDRASTSQSSHTSTTTHDS